jgi:hypothetical protein
MDKLALVSAAGGAIQTHGERGRRGLCGSYFHAGESGLLGEGARRPHGIVRGVADLP